MHRVQSRRVATALIIVNAVGARVVISGAHAAQPAYVQDSRSRPARVTGTWEIRGTEWQGIGAISSVARCGNEVFLADRQSRVRRLQLDNRKHLDDIGTSDDGGKLGRPWILAVDCVGHVLYVVDSGIKAVLSYRLPSGTFHQRIALPRTFVIGRSAEYVDPGLLYIGGLWHPQEQGPNWSFNKLDFKRFFETLRFGIRLDLKSGDMVPAFEPYEDERISASSCIDVNLVRVRAPGSIAWAVAHAGSEHVGLYDAKGKLVRTNDVRSPMFQRTGVPAGPFTPAREYILWKRENTEIDRIFGFGRLIATSHLQTNVDPDWNFGPINCRVRMNLQSLDGTGLISDIPLPEKPVGQDAQHIYVIDYGRGGRQPESESVRLLQILVTPRY
jgi:hypothetical protein